MNTDLKDALFDFKHAYKFAYDRRGMSENDSRDYASWYVMEYPDGDLEHSKAFRYWDDEVTGHREMREDR